MLTLLIISNLTLMFLLVVVLVCVGKHAKENLRMWNHHLAFHVAEQEVASEIWKLHLESHHNTQKPKGKIISLNQLHKEPN